MPGSVRPVADERGAPTAGTPPGGLAGYFFGCSW